MSLYEHHFYYITFSVSLTLYETVFSLAAVVSGGAENPCRLAADSSSSMNLVRRLESSILLTCDEKTMPQHTGGRGKRPILWALTSNVPAVLGRMSIEIGPGCATNNRRPSSGSIADRDCTKTSPCFTGVLQKTQHWPPAPDACVIWCVVAKAYCISLLTCPNYFLQLHKKSRKLKQK